MALPEVTYDEYKAFGGQADEAEFKALLQHGKAAVREIIGFNQPENEREIAAYKAAVCAAIDVDRQHGGSGGVGERGGGNVTIGSYSTGRASSATGGQSDPYWDDMIAAIKPHLIGTRLLYQVIL